MNQLTKITFLGITAFSVLVFSSCSNESNNEAKKETENVLTAETKPDREPESVTDQNKSSVDFVRSPKTNKKPRFIPASGFPHDKSAVELLRTAFKSEMQVFTISTASDTIIVGKSGTQVHIPAAAFVNASGEKVSGEISFSLIECYTPLEMFAHHLSTKTTDGRLLETGGSVFIDARQADEQLQLKPGHSLKVDFPKGEEELSGMHEFKGITTADGTVEWGSLTPDRSGTTALGYIKPSKEIASLNVTSKRAPQINLIEIKPSEEDAKTDLSAVKLNNGEGTLGDWLEKQQLNKGLLKERFIPGYQLEAKIAFDKKGKIAEIKSTLLVERTLLDELYKFFLKAPALDMSKIKSGEFYTAALKSKTLTKQTELKDYYTKNNMEWDPAYNSGLSKQENYYTLNIGWLGWVNCDRFRDDRQKVNMYVNGDSKTTVFMIFTKIASQISPVYLGDTWQFSSIPVGEPIRLIAIRAENDDLFMERLDTKVVSGNVNLKPIKKASREDIQKAFQL